MTSLLSRFQKLNNEWLARRRWVWVAYRWKMRRRHGPMWPVSDAPIPPEDIERARRFAIEQGWVEEDIVP